MTERRRADRQPLSVPINITTLDGRPRVGMLENVSDTGLAFYSRSTYEVGDRVNVAFHDGAARRDVTGRVVRTSLSETDAAFFHHVTGIRFEQRV